MTDSDYIAQMLSTLKALDDDLCEPGAPPCGDHELAMLKRLATHTTRGMTAVVGEIRERLGLPERRRRPGLVAGTPLCHGGR